MLLGGCFRLRLIRFDVALGRGGLAIGWGRLRCTHDDSGWNIERLKLRLENSFGKVMMLPFPVNKVYSGIQHTSKQKTRIIMNVRSLSEIRLSMLKERVLLFGMAPSPEH